MRQIVKDNVDSYSKNNVSGRVKMYEVMSTTGLTKVKGTWELTVANYFNKENIKWTNNIVPYNYFWNEAWHLYFPDFYLIDSDIVVEVKGFETDRDTCKWKSVIDKKFIVIKKEELKQLDSIFKQSILMQVGQVDPEGLISLTESGALPLPASKCIQLQGFLDLMRV